MTPDSLSMLPYWLIGYGLSCLFFDTKTKLEPEICVTGAIIAIALQDIAAKL